MPTTDLTLSGDLVVGDDATIGDALVVTGNLRDDAVATLYQTKIQGYFALNGTTSPTALAAGTTNDWDVSTEISTAPILNVTPNVAGSSLSGMVPNGIPGLLVAVRNVGAGTLTLKHADEASAAGNRFQLKGGVARVLAANECVLLLYTASAWYVIG